ncbi:MAG TPA: PQQ-binding-like beta-propeller repeat protein, partial [Thermoplasmata archaeon]|nr:PQQ-binding-like beta-propeller repeat protein [Thermoplasmata archaeon]
MKGDCAVRTCFAILLVVSLTSSAWLAGASDDLPTPDPTAPFVVRDAATSLERSAAVPAPVPAQVWERDLGPSPLIGMGVRDRVLFASTADGKVHAIDALDGTITWSADIGGRPLGPFPAPDYLLVSGDTVYGLEYEDGRVKWELPKDGSVFSPIFFRSDSAYVAKNDRLMSLAPVNGSVNWVSDPLGNDLQP